MILPDLSELVSLRGSAHGLSLNIRQPALAHLQGNHRSLQHGRGMEFEEVRLYAAGDDTRTIDWRVTARRGRPHTKLFREERERPVWLIADIHSGLFFGSQRQLKSALLLRAAALLGWTAVLNGDRLGAVITQNQHLPPLIFPPRTREAGVLPVLEALVEAQPLAPEQPDSTGLHTALITLRSLLKPGSLVLILSDFSNLDKNAEALLASIAMHSDCRLWWITDPLESTGLPAGTFRAGLPTQLGWLDGEGCRSAWLAAWTARQKHLEDLAYGLKLSLTQLTTAKAVTETLPSLLRAST